LGYIQATQDIVLHPNYAEGCRVFCDTFLAEAQARCPVRTGYLRSTISASSTASSITCMAGADYAQYVEYGTSRQSAQPYFEPAL
jgi:HK97 gp10 family phage protein